MIKGDGFKMGKKFSSIISFKVQNAPQTMFDITTYRISLKVRFFEASPSASRAVL